jgi:hypothetical protein
MHALFYFPCINVFSDLIVQEKLIFNCSFAFQRSSFRNRTIIAGPNGLITLSVPVVGGRSIKVNYDQVEIDYKQNWQRDHFRTLCTAYGNSPFFMFYKDELDELFNKKPNKLIDWNIICLNWVLDKIKLKKEVTLVIPEQYSSNIQNSTIFRERDLYTPQNFSSESHFNFISYSQLFQERNGFKPNLSILDLLFNYGKDTFQYLFKFQLNKLSKI